MEISYFQQFYSENKSKVHLYIIFGDVNRWKGVKYAFSDFSPLIKQILSVLFGI